MEDMWPLLNDHVEELATMPDLMELEPDLEKYVALEEEGLLYGLLAHDGDKVCGYSINILINSLHYKALNFFQNDVLFLDKGYRKGTLGLRLIRETEKQGRAAGADVMLWHAKPDTSLDKILNRKSYPLQDKIYSKVL